MGLLCVLFGPLLQGGAWVPRGSGSSLVLSEFLEGVTDPRATTDQVRIWRWPRTQLVKSGIPISFTPACPSLTHLDRPVMNEWGRGEMWGQDREQHRERQIEPLVCSVLWKEVGLPGRVFDMG